MDDARTARAVASNVRRLREGRGLSLDRLQRLSGVSKGLLVNLENGRTNPTIATLYRVAGALDTTIAGLLETESRTRARIFRERPRVLWKTAAGSRARFVLCAPLPQRVEYWDWLLAPGDAYAGEPHEPGTLELLHVLEGTLALTVGRRTHPLREGRSLIFSAAAAHVYQNAGRRRVRFLMTVIEPVKRGGR